MFGNLSSPLEMQRLLRFSSGAERATPQAFCIRKAVSAPAAAAGGLGTKPGSLQYAAGNPRVASSPGSNTHHGSTADFLHGGNGGGGTGSSRRLAGGSVRRLPHAARWSRAGSLQPEERGERLC